LTLVAAAEKQKADSWCPACKFSGMVAQGSIPMTELDICKEPANRLTVHLATERGSGLGGERLWFQLLAEFLNFAQAVLAFANLNQFVPVGLGKVMRHSTVLTVFGHQEGAEVGYNPRYRGKRS
jgi:hypothetical protein